MAWIGISSLIYHHKNSVHMFKLSEQEQTFFKHDLKCFSRPPRRERYDKTPKKRQTRSSNQLMTHNYPPIHQQVVVVKIPTTTVFILFHPPSTCPQKVRNKAIGEKYSRGAFKSTQRNGILSYFQPLRCENHPLFGMPLFIQ